jgi:hypothetical protein
LKATLACLKSALIASLLVVLWTCIANAQEINIEKLADAIYYAEGGAKTAHPYGILTHYKHTTPRQACINTIKHALKDYDGASSFIEFLGKRYCPIGAQNDPTGLNVNWVKNVTYLYNKLIAKEKK